MPHQRGDLIGQRLGLERFFLFSAVGLALKLRIRHGHHLIGNTIRFLFVFVIGLTDGGFGLCAGGVEVTEDLGACCR